jgi:hypothetical protein
MRWKKLERLDIASQQIQLTLEAAGSPGLCPGSDIRLDSNAESNLKTNLDTNSQVLNLEGPLDMESFSAHDSCLRRHRKAPKILIYFRLDPFECPQFYRRHLAEVLQV